MVRDDFDQGRAVADTANVVIVFVIGVEETVIGGAGEVVHVSAPVGMDIRLRGPDEVFGEDGVPSRLIEFLSDLGVPSVDPAFEVQAERDDSERLFVRNPLKVNIGDDAGREIVIALFCAHQNPDLVSREFS